MEALAKRKLMVAVANSGITGNHQVLFLEKLSRISGLSPSELRNLIPLARAATIELGEPHIAEFIKAFSRDPDPENRR